MPRNVIKFDFAYTLLRYCFDNTSRLPRSEQIMSLTRERERERERERASVDRGSVVVADIYAIDRRAVVAVLTTNTTVSARLSLTMNANDRATPRCFTDRNLITALSSRR